MTPDAAARLAVSRGTGSLAARGAGVADRVGKRPSLALIAVAALVSVLVLYLSRDLTFFLDEIPMLARTWSAEGLLAPSNEHWSTGIAVIYLALTTTIGTSSYLPFMVVLVAAHLFAATAVWALVSRDAPDRAAAATTLFLVFGAGAENLFWAFQVGFILATALGCWALVVAPSRPAVAAAILALGVATAGPALAFIPGAAFLVGRRPAVAWLGLPVIAYLIWERTFGAGTVGQMPGSFEFAALPGYVATGVATAFGSVLVPSIVIGIAVIVVVVVSWRRERPTPTAMASLIVLLALFTVIGLVRAQMGTAEAQSSRYLYVAAPLVLTILAGIDLPRLRLVALYAVALGSQVVMLIIGHATQVAKIAQ